MPSQSRRHIDLISMHGALCGNISPLQLAWTQRSHHSRWFSLPRARSNIFRLSNHAGSKKITIKGLHQAHSKQERKGTTPWPYIQASKNVTRFSRYARGRPVSGALSLQGSSLRPHHRWRIRWATACYSTVDIRIFGKYRSYHRSFARGCVCWILDPKVSTWH